MCLFTDQALRVQSSPISTKETICRLHNISAWLYKDTPPTRVGMSRLFLRMALGLRHRAILLKRLDIPPLVGRVLHYSTVLHMGYSTLIKIEYTTV
jgi:hypothetical protein